MKVGAIIILILISSGSPLGQKSDSTQGPDENIYQVAIEKFIGTLPSGDYLYISDNNGTLTLMTNEIARREIVFINSLNEQEELEKNGNILRMYELEYPSIQGDVIIIKINHFFLFQIPLPLDELNWPKGMTEQEKESARLSIYRAEHSDDFKKAKTYSSISQNSCTYVTFKFESKLKRFKFQKVETRMM